MVRKVRKKYIGEILFIVIISLLVFSLIFDEKIINSDSTVFLSFLLIILICVFGVLSDKHKYSLNKTFWLFNLIFMGISPFVQYINKYNQWEYVLTDSDYKKTNFLIVFSFIVYYIFYKISYYKKTKRLVYNYKKNDEIIISYVTPKESLLKKINWIFPCISVFCLIVLSKFIGFSGLFYRDSNSIETIDDSLIKYLVNYTLRSMPVYCFLLTYWMRKRRKNNISLFVQLIVLIICNFPTSVTRFWMGAIYLGLIVLFTRKINNKRVYDLMVLSIFIFIFPLFSIFKQIDISKFNFSFIKNYSILDGFISVDFDAYSILSRSIIYYNKNGSVSGSQIIGTILFFIPRKFWPGKPEATGAFIARAQNQWYTNISCPLAAEGLVNFGYFGVVIFVGVFSYLLNSIDYIYWNDEKGNSSIKLIYPFILGFYIFLLRGAIHHAIVYFFIFLIPLFIFNTIRTIRIHKYRGIYIKGR